MTNGQGLKYTNWGPGQPDALLDQNRRRFEHCVELNNVDKLNKFMWNNIDCTQEHPFICEKYD